MPLTTRQPPTHRHHFHTHPNPPLLTSNPTLRLQRMLQAPLPPPAPGADDPRLPKTPLHEPGADYQRRLKTMLNQPAAGGPPQPPAPPPLPPQHPVSHDPGHASASAQHLNIQQAKGAGVDHLPTGSPHDTHRGLPLGIGPFPPISYMRWPLYEWVIGGLLGLPIPPFGAIV